ncbi:MAG: phosphoribosylformylglycinamidine synthase subunit PurS [Elusimicrobiota bacterium]|jgi:phosphoribosylformylglycinamidine synthase|nr:phosphoribosylformylglycinamidine synthase subunit PurS [Elusimicrobiota bacterium]
MYKIEIKTKENFRDARGEYYLYEIISMGFDNVKKVKYCPLYIIKGDISDGEAEIIARQLLIDEITEDYSIKKENEILSPIKVGGAIEVWYKKGVTDTVAQSVQKAVKDLGIDKKIEVNTGHKYYLFGDISDEDLALMAEKLFANTLIQGYEIENHALQRN